MVFHEIFAICNQKEWSVYKVLRGRGINLTFRRNFGEKEKEEWDELILLLEGVSLSHCPDSVRWCLEKSGNFSTSSLYKALTYPGVENKWMNSIWRAGLPLKIKMFLWQVCNDKIQSAEQLRKKNWSGPIECKLCGQVESTKHIFVKCVLASFCWSVFRDVLEWDLVPCSLEDLHEKLVEGSISQRNNFVFLFGYLSWSLWLIRNNFVFNNVLVSSPKVSMYRTLSFVQKWRILLKEKERLWMDPVTTKLKRRLSSLGSV
jgi:hypothetical protein